MIAELEAPKYKPLSLNSMLSVRADVTEGLSSVWSLKQSAQEGKEQMGVAIGFERSGMWETAGLLG